MTSMKDETRFGLLVQTKNDRIAPDRAPDGCLIPPARKQDDGNGAAQSNQYSRAKATLIEQGQPIPMEGWQ